MYINYLNAPRVPNLATDADAMARTIDNLKEDPNITRIIFVQQRNYSHNFEQVNLLIEVLQLYEHLINQEKVLLIENINQLGSFAQEAYSFLNYILNQLLKSDPIKAYKELRSTLVEQKVILERGQENKNYVRLLERVLSNFEQLTLIKKAKELFNLYPSNNREIYSEFFRADIMPNFTFTRMVAQIPKDAEIIKEYEIADTYDKSLVTIYKKPEETKYIYHISPPEYNLREEHHMLLNLAKNVLIEHSPTKEEFSDQERIRQVFLNLGKDLLNELATSKGITLTYEENNLLSRILVRHTIGFGVLEVLLEDESLQDLVINAPFGSSPIFVRHNDFGQCSTNIRPSQEDADSWATKFRMSSGRALDEANPILDTSLDLPNATARASIIQNPLSSGGIAYALRRHRNNPWTLPLFIENKMINGLGAGLLSFIIDGARTILVAGTRSSGKTSLLGSLLLEIMPNNRIITIEDTLELPINSMKKLNYDILSMNVRSSLGSKESTEVGAAEGIRASLRLGDSSLIVGEIRSEEAKALYEAMRIGALANVVAGTIHGGSPYSVFDRVCNDLGVPVTSFKATDIIVICNPVKTADGLHSKRRVLSVCEVRKHWKEDPLTEGGFVELLKYNIEKDELEPTQALINGDSEILKDIASGVKGWAGNWDAVWDNVLLRQKIKEELVENSRKNKMPELLEAEFLVKANNVFHQVSEEITEEEGLPSSKKVFPKWKDWLEKETKNYKK